MFGYSEKNSLNKDISDLSKTINYNHILQKFDFTLKISKEYIYIPTEISLVPIFFYMKYCLHFHAIHHYLKKKKSINLSQLMKNLC